MNNIYKYLIELTKAYLNNETITLKSEIDYADLFKLASKHNLSGVIYCVLSRSVNKEIISADLMNKMQNNFFDFIYISHMQSQTAELAKKALTDAGIRHIPFKGIELRNYFPVPESCFMGDIDILIDENDRDRAKTAMKAAGFTVKNENGPVWDYVKDTVLIEMHTNLLNETIDKKQTIDYFSDAVNKADFNGLCGKFDDTFHLEYLMAHIAHHFRFYGAGIKLVLDIAVMLKYGSVDRQVSADFLRKFFQSAVNGTIRENFILMIPKQQKILSYLSVHSEYTEGTNQQLLQEKIWKKKKAPLPF